MNEMTQTLTSQITSANPGESIPIEELPLPYVETDANGNISCINASAQHILGLDREEIIGHSAWETMARDQIAESRDAFFKMIEAASQPAPIRRAILDKDGAYRTCDLFRTLMRNGDGTVTGVRHFAVDVTEAVQAQQEAHQTRVWFESILESFPSAVIVTDALGFIRYSNPAIEKLTGWLPSELDGQILDKRLPVLSYTPDDGIPLIDNARFEHQCTGAATILDRKRYQIRVRLETTPISDRQTGWVSGIINTLSRLPEPVVAP
jgi:PAS domain S-box-containing protein